MTAIEWTDSTWNPLVGCSKVSAGCRGCYAETVATGNVRRLAATAPGSETLAAYREAVSGGRWTGRVVLNKSKLGEPLGWKKPRRVFVNSMSDLFHESVPFETIAAVFGVMAACPQHTFQVLTKRPARMLEWFAWIERAGASFVRRGVNACRGVRWYAWCYEAGVEPNAGRPWAWPLPNVWLGVSAEDQTTADERIPLLLQTPAAKRFVSLEPLLGPIDLERPWAPSPVVDGVCPPMLNWVIVGGESGPSARPMHPDWARSLRDQCQRAGVPFFFKQWGQYVDIGDAHKMAERGYVRSGAERVVNRQGGHGFHGVEPRNMRRVGKRHAGRLLDGVEWSEVPR